MAAGLCQGDAGRNFALRKYGADVTEPSGAMSDQPSSTEPRSAHAYRDATKGAAFPFDQSAG